MSYFLVVFLTAMWTCLCMGVYGIIINKALNTRGDVTFLNNMISISFLILFCGLFTVIATLGFIGLIDFWEYVKPK